MNVKNAIHLLPDHPDSPVEGEVVLASMLQWAAKGNLGSGSLAGLVELNWTGQNNQGPIYDLVAGRQRTPLYSLTVEQALQMLVSLEDRGLALEMLYLAGADPAGHPQLADFIELARQKGISRIGLQCNGLRIANDDQLLDMLVRLRPLLFVEFDGFDETASLILHGRRDLPYEAKRGLDRLATAGLPVALLASVAQGINLQEVGAIAAFGLNHPAVFSAIFRPVPPRLSRLETAPSSRVTASAMMAALEQQSGGLFRRDDFTPALCCRPERHYYAQVPYENRNGAPATGGSCSLALDGSSSCFWLSVHEFMTPWSKDLQQARLCPLVIMTSEGQTTPYCLYNAEEEA